MESFKETLELGLQKPEQIVVRAIYPILEERNVFSVTAHWGVAGTPPKVRWAFSRTQRIVTSLFQLGMSFYGNCVLFLHPVPFMFLHF